MNDGRQFLFELPNNFKKLHSNKLLFYGLILFLSGMASVLNGAIATALEAVKSYHVAQYVNTHWITSTFVLAGLSTILAERLRINFFLFSSVCFNSLSVSIAVGSFIFDCININVVSLQQNVPYITKLKQPMIIYSVVDLITSAIAMVSAVLALVEIRRICGRYFASIDELKTKALLLCGGFLCLIGEVKQVLWVLEVIWLRSVGESTKYMFLNYTMDEPVWNMIYLLTGIMNVSVCMTGGRVLSYCTLILTLLSAFPAIQYLWIDYRWMMTIKITDMVSHVPKPHAILQLNIACSILHIFIIFVSCFILVKNFVKVRLPWSTAKVTFEANIQQTIKHLGMLLFAAGVVFLITDVVNISSGTFFRMFYPTEQKLPFFLIPTGVLCFVMIRYNEFIPFAVPSIIVLLLLCLQATAFHIASYLYLSHNRYFGDQICDLFFFGKYKCSANMERTGAAAHFFEAALAVSVLTLCLYGSFVFCRMCCLLCTPLKYPFNEQENNRKYRHELSARVLAGSQLVLGIGVLLVSLFVFDNDPADYYSHPLIVIHTIIHRTTITLLLIIFPLVQLSLTNDVHIYPMKALTCIAIACVRMTDILIQLDYRNLAYLGVAWTVMTAIELAALIMQFGIMAECAILLDLGLNQLPQLDFTNDDEVGHNIDPPSGTRSTLQLSLDNESESKTLPDYKDSEDNIRRSVQNNYVFEGFARHPDEQQI